MDSSTSRRDLLRASVVLGIGGLVSACALSKLPPDSITSDINLIASGVGGLVAALGLAHVSIPQSVLDGVNAAIADIKANAGKISGAVAGNQGSIVGNIMTDLGVLTDLLAPFFPAAPLAYTILSAAVSLGKFVYTAITGTPVAAPQEAIFLVRGAHPLMQMTPEEARKALGM